MSDLLSPFVVIFEDNADAFWCFEMLLRRMVITNLAKIFNNVTLFAVTDLFSFTYFQRENFQMEGPTRVMKQLRALWHILELTDKEIFTHLSKIGAESLHFAFRMLLVLFRRELSFNEALSMWEVCAACSHPHPQQIPLTDLNMFSVPQNNHDFLIPPPPLSIFSNEPAINYFYLSNGPSVIFHC